MLSSSSTDMMVGGGGTECHKVFHEQWIIFVTCR